ncbi:hypothetical protein CAPTEDRAFT_222814 [Capitella teleta]|uniref:Uncharacterized protein n=1 Tax=Capitella teleta TaxID=283909 RepID=R7TJL5_CAPTE|nr:hypothetical protein CAPTEDRAFT_222814 [Capitella teleta]|eukprot:ELT94018.1 hypothetical protein CAPTEDRAFT_222814 [Capitella teleta]
MWWQCEAHDHENISSINVEEHRSRLERLERQFDMLHAQKRLIEEKLNEKWAGFYEDAQNTHGPRQWNHEFNMFIRNMEELRFTIVRLMDKKAKELVDIRCALMATGVIDCLKGEAPIRFFGDTDEVIGR